MNRKTSFFDGASYRGYRVSVRLIREGLKEYEPVKLDGPERVYDFMKDLNQSDRERFYSLFLDTKNILINCEEVSSGCLDLAIVHPREVFKSAILCSSYSIILVHNHPSGDPTPSMQDKDITMKLYDCGDLLGIDVLDSVIIGNDSYYSFMEAGVMDTYKAKKTILR